MREEGASTPGRQFLLRVGTIQRARGFRGLSKRAGSGEERAMDQEGVP